MTDGIRIPDDVAAEVGVPEELDSGQSFAYVFPDPRRRRLSGLIYLAFAALLVWPALTVDSMYLAVAAVLVGLSLWHLAAAWELGIDQTQALDRAAGAVPFVVGHASAAISFSGLRARPRWQVIVYSPEEPPIRRGLVEIDAVTGAQVGDVYLEDVPDI